MTPHVHHWDSMMIFEETTKSLFPSDLFIQPGNNKPVISDDLSGSMIDLYRGIGIFASEKPVREVTKRILRLSPKMVMYYMSLYPRSKKTAGDSTNNRWLMHDSKLSLGLTLRLLSKDR